MFAYVRFYYGSIYTGTENGMDFIILSTSLNNVERQQGVTALLLYQVQTVTPLQSIETVNPPNTLSKKCPTSVGYFYCYIMKNNFLKMD